MSRSNSSRQLGLEGARYINDTVAQTGNWFCFTVITEAVLAAIDQTSSTGATFDNLADLIGVTLPAGLTIYGHFSSLDLASGSIIAYNI